MQDWRDAGLEGDRTGGRQAWKESRMQDWKDAGKEGFMKGVM